MDSTNNNNNNPAGSHHRHQKTVIRSKSQKWLEEVGNTSEQFVSSVNGENDGKSATYEKQQQQEKSNSRKSSLHRTILLASKSNGESSNEGGGGSRSVAALQDALYSTDDDGWWMEENAATSSFSCLERTTNPAREGKNFVTAAGSSKEVKENIGVGSSSTSSNFATWELDNKIDSDAAVLVEEGGKGRFGGKLGQDSGETTAVAATVVTSSFLHQHHLAQVDPIVDFFTVDEELVGRFRISSCLSPLQVKRNSSCVSSSSEEGGILQQQQAIIFKIRTTSPYSCWVRPIYGLMRPNVIAWVEVKCELKANSLTEFEKNMDEFLVEICPVPGAIHTMTSDLYTNDVHSNLPELLNIWEVVEQELKQNQQQLQGFVKEFHKVSCRFQRQVSLVEVSTTAQQQQQDIISQVYSGNEDNSDRAEAKSNNNVNNFQWNPFNSVQAHKERYHLAREFPSYNNGQNEKKRSSGVHSSLLRWEEQRREDDHDEDFGQGQGSGRACRCSGCCRTSRQLCCLVFVLTILLFASLVFIGYSQYYHHFSYCNNANSNSDNVKKNLILEHAFNDKENINHDLVSSTSTDIKRDFRK